MFIENTVAVFPDEPEFGYLKEHCTDDKCIYFFSVLTRLTLGIQMYSIVEKKLIGAWTLELTPRREFYQIMRAFLWKNGHFYLFVFELIDQSQQLDVITVYELDQEFKCVNQHPSVTFEDFIYLRDIGSDYPENATFVRNIERVYPKESKYITNWFGRLIKQACDQDLSDLVNRMRVFANKIGYRLFEFDRFTWLPHSKQLLFIGVDRYVNTFIVFEANQERLSIEKGYWQFVETSDNQLIGFDKRNIIHISV